MVTSQKPLYCVFPSSFTQVCVYCRDYHEFKEIETSLYKSSKDCSIAGLNVSILIYNLHSIV